MTPLETLALKDLGSVIFVGDYLQLDFSDARFTAYIWPTVTVDGVSRRMGDVGYRSALCALISHMVIDTEESAEAGLLIRFGLGEVVINPKPIELWGPEIAKLQVDADAFRDAMWDVWRPGEGVFANRDWS